MNRNLMMALAAVLALGGMVHAQRQVHKLVASDPEPFDEFGCSVAIDGEWAAVSAPNEDELVDQSGAVYIFHLVGGVWVETQKLKASDASFGMILGESIAMSGDMLVVGAAWDSSSGLGGAGSVYVFERFGTTWTETAKVTASDPEQEAFFGRCVATSGYRIAVSAVLDDANAVDSGAVYVFDRVGGNWVETVKLVASDAEAFDVLGTSLGLLGDTLLVGMAGKEGPGGDGQGAAYVYEKGPTGWMETKKLLAPDGATSDHFGTSVGLQTGRALVGAPAKDHPVNVGLGGAVYVFEKSGTDWAQTQEYWPDDNRSGDQFGVRLVVASDRLIVTAHNDDNWGSAYHFSLSGSTWIQAGKLLYDDPAMSDVFGCSVAMSAETVIVGVMGDDDGCTPPCESGSAYIFHIAPTAIQFGHCPTAAPCANYDTHGGCRNSTGEGSILAAAGTGSVTTDELQLEATHVPPGKLALLFMAPAQAYVPYGDGIRVVKAQAGVALYRLGAITADATGSVLRGPDIVAQTQNLPAPGHIQAGQTWRFQMWHRDSVSQGPCHTGTNFTNGVAVAFGP